MKERNRGKHNERTSSKDERWIRTSPGHHMPIVDGVHIPSIQTLTELTTTTPNTSIICTFTCRVQGRMSTMHPPHPCSYHCNGDEVDRANLQKGGIGVKCREFTCQ